MGVALSLALDTWAFVGFGIAIGVAFGVALDREDDGSNDSGGEGRE
jgi:hypothetical protein